MNCQLQWYKINNCLLFLETPWQGVSVTQWSIYPSWACWCFQIVTSCWYLCCSHWERLLCSLALWFLVTCFGTFCPLLSDSIIASLLSAGPLQRLRQPFETSWKSLDQAWGVWVGEGQDGTLSSTSSWPCQGASNTQQDWHWAPNVG